MIYAIKQWSDTFENSETRKRQRLGWFLAPTGCDSKGYRQLTRKGTQGLIALGVFHSLCQLMGTLSKEVRAAGKFINTDGSGMEVADLQEMTRMPLADIQQGLADLQEVGWIITEGEPLTEAPAASVPPTCHPRATHVPPSSHQPPGFCKGEGEGKGQVEGEGQASCPPADGWEALWSAAPKKSRERSSKKQVKGEWLRLGATARPSTKEALDALEAWKVSEKWQEGYAEGLHLWIRHRKWEDLPESAQEPQPSAQDLAGGRKLKIKTVAAQSNRKEEQDDTLPI